MLAIYKRELASYFRSPIGWVAIALFALMGGYFFSFSMQMQYAINISEELTFLQSALIVVIPLITMRLFSEERKNGTEVLFYTAPVSLMRVVVGKYLASLTLFIIMTSNVLVHMFLLGFLGGTVNASTWGALLAFVMLGAMFIAIGTFASVITENQIIAAVTSFAIILFTTMMQMIAFTVQSMVFTVMQFINPFDLSEAQLLTASERVRNAFLWLDPMSRSVSFSYGVFDLRNIIFYLSFVVLFIFLTYRMLEKRRWSQGG